MEQSEVKPEVYWKPQSRRQPETKLVAVGFTGTDRLVGSLAESDVEPHLKEEVINILKYGWSNIAGVLHDGGIVTSAGVIVQGMPIPHRRSTLQSDLDANFVIEDTAGGLRRRYKLRPEDLKADPNRKVWLINAGTDKRLFYRYDSYRPHPNVLLPAIFLLDNNDRVRSFWIHGLVTYFHQLYKEANIPEIIASDSAVQQILLDISKHFGLGRRDDIERM